MRPQDKADRGIHDKVGAGHCRPLQAVCRQMESALKRSDFEGGAVAGLRALSQQLLTHFPATCHGANGLPDEPVLV